MTGNFCDEGVSVAYDHCFASERVPANYLNNTAQSVESSPGTSNSNRKGIAMTENNHTYITTQGLPLQIHKNADDVRCYLGMKCIADKVLHASNVNELDGLDGWHVIRDTEQIKRRWVKL